MQRRSTTRTTAEIGLLARSPWTGNDMEPRAPALVVDPIDQLNQLVELTVAGFLSTDEFERQKAKVLGGSG